MAGKSRYDPDKIRDVPEGEPFVMYSREFIASVAFRAASPQCRRLLDFLELEHMAHGAKENGSLLAPHDQLYDFGIGKSDIARTIEEAEALGLVRVEYGGKKNSCYDYPSRFTLTYRKTLCRDQNKIPYWTEPTHDWRHTTTEKAATARTPRKRKN